MIVNILGAGGHAKVVIATLEALGHRVGGVYDDADALQDREILGARVSGRIGDAPRDGGFMVIAIGNNEMRRRIATEIGRDANWLTVVHPGAWVHHSARLGSGTVVFAGAVVQPEVVIGEHCIVNTGATVDHDCVLGDFAHVAPAVALAGDVHVGDGALLGIGACVIPGRRIGAWSTVAAGTAVVRDVPHDVTVAGVPGRVVPKGRAK